MHFIYNAPILTGYSSVYLVSLFCFLEKVGKPGKLQLKEKFNKIEDTNKRYTILITA